MKVLERYSEPYAAHGSMAGVGVWNQLGRPNLEGIELLIREALQNCWDAASSPGEDPVRVTIEFRALKPDEKHTLLERCFTNPPPDAPVRTEIEASDQILVVSDRGTIGLAGPLRADEVTAPGEPTDFVDFVRNVGQPPDREFGAGSFGYGKGAFYRCSAARAIIIYTRTEYQGQLQTRLIAAGLGDQTIESVDGAGARRLTGRHWWGDIAEDGIVDPILDREAIELADAIGLPGWEEGETGTTIAIIAPRLLAGDGEENDDPALVLDTMARSISWHFWPKLFSEVPSMRVTLLRDGDEVPLPGPETDAYLAAFVSAKRRLDGLPPIEGALDHRLIEIRSQRPKALLGHLSIELRNAPEHEKPAVALSTPEGAPLSHAALMRDAELVVRYEKGTPLPATGLGYAAVFRCNKELDQIFRNSEPPSHDEWNAKSLAEPGHQTMVRVAQREIRNELNAFATRHAEEEPEDHSVPLGKLSGKLAGLFPSETGPGASHTHHEAARRRSGSARGRSSSPLKLISPARPAERDGQVVVEATIEAVRDVDVRMVPGVVILEGAIESATPLSADTPEAIGWISSDGTRITGDTLSLKQGDRVTAIASALPDVSVAISFEEA